MGRLNEILTLAQARATKLQLPYAGAMTPQEANEVRQLAPNAAIVDVRTRAERDWVGRVPEAIEIEWATYPDMQANPQFMEALKHAVTTDALLLFLCRSGARSSAAAKAASAAGYPSCYNILEGFEGDKDASNQRNQTN
ncbi:MAG: rhodanese-like domain-containing protein, partial [Rugosibacter sp.]